MPIFSFADASFFAFSLLGCSWHSLLLHFFFSSCFTKKTFHFHSLQEYKNELSMSSRQFKVRIYVLNSYELVFDNTCQVRLCYDTSFGPKQGKWRLDWIMAEWMCPEFIRHLVRMDKFTVKWGEVSCHNRNLLRSQPLILWRWHTACLRNVMKLMTNLLPTGVV